MISRTESLDREERWIKPILVWYERKSIETLKSVVVEEKETVKDIDWSVSQDESDQVSPRRPVGKVGVDMGTGSDSRRSDRKTRG